MPKSDNPRLLLARVRNGDFAHPGDSEAIDIVLQKLKKISPSFTERVGGLNEDCVSRVTGKALDVGCGLGGTAAYLAEKTSLEITGIDLDPVAIQFAQSHYPQLNFFESDVMNVDSLFQSCQFDMMVMFNVFYALSDQKMALKKLAQVAKQGSFLVIFDYVNEGQNRLSLKDLSGRTMTPIVNEDLLNWLGCAGWESIEAIDLTNQYRDWYVAFLQKLEATKVALLKDFTEEAFDKVRVTFSEILKAILESKLGGRAYFSKLTKTLSEL